ncbi:MAG TPA: hypothetical protein DCM54_10735 [Gammaproteobacteria bacterium]|nr:hypothetical protein [Gammaproteobacteria bacterium]|tara:strand:- start:1439 stop:2149 length:711 start_codon:yes stop_codon:yes gene_type:complete
MNRLSVAVVTGGHKFHVRPFTDFFNSLDGVDPYIQHFDDWLSPSGVDDDPWFADTYGTSDLVHQEVRDSFDITLLYTLVRGPLEGAAKASVERLIETGKPIFILHHALFNWREDARWGEIMGLSSERTLRQVDYGGPMNGIWFGEFPVKVNTDHPASAGLSDFEIDDETYALPDCDEDCDVLLTTEHESSMRTLAWTRMEGDSRIFCMQLGHDPKSWHNPAFRTLIQNGLKWCSDR